MSLFPLRAGQTASNKRRLGREMVQKTKRDGVDAVILTST